jgi:hypothetical protein
MKIINYFNFENLQKNMQSIKGKKESLLRVLGMGLILIGLIASIIFDFFILSTTLYILTLVIFIPWFILIVLLKLEKDFFVDNMSKFLIVLGIFFVVIIIISMIISPTNALVFVFLGISDILVLFCWHFALSIFKKEKLIFLLGGIIFSIITAIFRLSILITNIGLLLGVSSLLLIIIGMLAILLAEIRMKKKGLLNYV